MLTKITEEDVDESKIRKQVEPVVVKNDWYIP
jgi:hypothetical protein